MDELLTFVEIDVDRCANVYQTLPCLAPSVGDVTPLGEGYAFQAEEDNDFTVANGATTAGDDYLTLTASGDCQFITPDNLKIDGTKYWIIEIEWERVTNSAFDGTVYYKTAGHTFSASFRKKFDNITGRQKTQIDMSALTEGDDDWTTHDITQVRFDFDQTSGGVVRIYAIKIGKIADETDGFSHKCFNTLKSCQFRPTLTPQTETLRFAMPTMSLPLDIDAIPSIQSISFSPATISLGENLGQRATLTVTFKDHAHPDTGPGGDRYLDSRDYDPYKKGTFWGKFRARYPYLVGRSIRVIRGVVGQALADMDTRYYIIDSFDGPTPDGTFSIMAKDVLKLADDDKSQAPKLSVGFLSANIDDDDTSFTVQPTGAGDLYASSGYINIGGSEICAFTRSGDTFTITRAQFNTTAQEHSAQDRVQECLHYDAESPADILKDLFVNYANIPDDYIPIDRWQDEVDTFLQRSYTALIPDPVGIKTLASELVEQAALALWWDDVHQTIMLRVLRAITKDAQIIDEDFVNAGSVNISEQPDLRISQVWTYYALINPLVDLEETSNYRSVEATVSLQLQSDYGSPAVKQIFSRWIPQFGRSVATQLNSIILGRYQNPPRKIMFQSHGRSSSFIALGAGYNMQFRTLQDEEGGRVTVPIQVTRLDPGMDLYKVEAQEALFLESTETDLSTRTIVIDTDTANFNLRTVHDTLFPVIEDGTDITVVCVIPSGVTVSGKRQDVDSPRYAAFDVGEWPDTPPTIEIRLGGDIRGGGGNAMSSRPGGTAFKTTVPTTIACASSTPKIYGGGGGGGTGSRILGVASTITAGGGGGAGIPGGLGAPGSGSLDGKVGTADAGGQGAHDSRAQGGDGGDPGEAGEDGNPTSNSSSGGLAGYAIDGDSFVTFSDATPDIKGGQVN